jgi:thiol-disulfide isomerase/thioredoxin
MRPGPWLALALTVLPRLGEPAAAGEPRLRPVDHAAWQQALAEHAREIVVVDFWATWCLPCLERFPRMVELSESYAAHGVTFIAFSLDDIEDEGALRFAERFAGEQGGRIEHYVTTEKIPTAFEKLGLLGIPAVYVYDRGGKLVERLTADDPNAQFTDEDVERAIREQLAQ